MKIDLPGGEWAQLETPKEMTRGDVVDMLEWAEDQGLDLSGKLRTRTVMRLQGYLVTKYVSAWSYVGGDGQPVPVTHEALDAMGIRAASVLAKEVAPVLDAALGVEEPDPTSVAGSSTTPPTG